LGRRHGRESKTLHPVERLIEELFHVHNHIFIVNSKKDVVENFQICLKHYLRYGDMMHGNQNSNPPFPSGPEALLGRRLKGGKGGLYEGVLK